MRHARAAHIAHALILALVASAAALTLAPAAAHADIFKLWVAGRGDYFSGTSDLFTEFQQPFGGGLEVGTEVLFINLFAEGLVMGPDQFLITTNLGFDTTFGDKVRFHMGIYTGPMFFIFPKGESAAGLSFDNLSAAERDALEAYVASNDQYGSIDELEAEFNAYAEREQDLSRLAFGWNLGRARLGLDVNLGGPVYLGIGGEVGYHYIISGEDAAAGAKNAAIDQYAAENNIPNEVTDVIRSAVGAEPIDTTALDGINYNGHVYLRFEFGTGGDDYE